MYPGSQRQHGSGNESARPFQVPPPPPPMSPPVPTGHLNSIANFPPPPLPPPPPPPLLPLYPSPGGPGVLVPAPSGPHGHLTGNPVNPVGQLAGWHGGVLGRPYDGRPGYNIPPPPPSSQLPMYNPKLHAQLNTSQRPRPSAISDKLDMGPTYVPTGTTYGEGVGIPGFGVEESLAMNTAGVWPPNNPTSTTNSAAAAASLDDSNGRSTNVPPEVAAQWPLDTVLVWLAKNQFSQEWQRTFEALDLCGAQFLELGSTTRPRGSLSVMHNHVYPRLAQECGDSDIPFDKKRERDEGNRLRRLVRNVRKESEYSAQGMSLPSAGTDPADSPKVRSSSAASFFAKMLYAGRLPVSDRRRLRQTWLAQTPPAGEACPRFAAWRRPKGTAAARCLNQTVVISGAGMSTTTAGATVQRSASQLAYRLPH